MHERECEGRRTLYLSPCHQKAEIDRALHGTQRGAIWRSPKHHARTNTVVAGIVSQPSVFQVWNGRNKLYRIATIHRCTRYLEPCVVVSQSRSKAA